MADKKKKPIIKKPLLKKDRPAVPLPTLPVIASKSQRDEAKGQDKVGIGTSVLSLQCPYCQSQDFVKRGTRLKKGGKTQLYLCRACKRTFTPVWFKGRQHSWQVILDAMSYYNLGFSLEQVCKIMNMKKAPFNKGGKGDFEDAKSNGGGDNAKRPENVGIGTLQPSTLSAWLEKYGQLCAYKRMRSFGLKMYSPYEIIETCTLAHRQLYRFRYHKATTKLIMADDFKHFKFKPMKEFLDNVTAETPHQYFQRPAAEVEPALGKQSLGGQILRASEAPLKFSKTEMIVRAKHNYACALAGLVFQGVSDNKQRHEALQKFFLANDSVTVATEVPVYLRREDLEHMQTQLGFKLYTKNKDAEKNDDANSLREIDSNEIPKLITGHIDFLQIRNGAIHILDYKGCAAKERPIEQLTLYALALSRLTGLRLFHFKCAWFDENDYFEFFPLHVVYKRNRGRKRIKTIEGVYNLNEKVNKIENLRPMV